MKVQDTNITQLNKQYKQLYKFIAQLGFENSNPLECIKYFEKHTKLEKKDKLFEFLIFTLPSPNHINTHITINLLEKKIIYIDVPHSCMKEDEIYEFTTYWIGVVPKIRKISEFLKTLKETKKKNTCLMGNSPNHSTR